MASLADYKTALEAALYSGALTVEHNGKRVTYRTVAELERQLALINQGIADTSATAAPRVLRVSTSKGLC